MADRRAWFGTRERMTWIKAPNPGVDMSRFGWGTTGTYLSGGGFSRSSTTKHAEPSLTWSFMNHAEAKEITDYADGMYGSGPIFYVDPMTMTRNTLPFQWSVPRIAAEDGPSWVVGKRPTLVDTPPNSIGLPTKSALYQLSPLDTYAEIFIPAPPWATVNIWIWGSSSGAVYFDAIDALGYPEELSLNTSNPVLGGPQTLALRCLTPGTLTLSGIMVTIDGPWPNGMPSRFYSGGGTSGLAFKPNSPTVTGYSSPEARDYLSVTADFIEVGDWL